MDNWALFSHTYMHDLSTWPVFSFMQIWLWSPTPVLVGLLIFVVYLETVKGLLGPNFSKCVCVYMLAYHTLYTNRDLLQVKFEKKNMICNKWENMMSIWTITSPGWNFLPVKKIVWAFFAFVVWRLPKVNESECQQCLLVAYNCRIMTSRLKTRSHLLL